MTSTENDQLTARQRVDYALMAFVDSLSGPTLGEPADGSLVLITDAGNDDALSAWVRIDGPRPVPQSTDEVEFPPAGDWRRLGAETDEPTHFGAVLPENGTVEQLYTPSDIRYRLAAFLKNRTDL